jgi:hypothetical protein
MEELGFQLLVIFFARHKPGNKFPVGSVIVISMLRSRRLDRGMSGIVVICYIVSNYVLTFHVSCVSFAVSLTGFWK